MKILHITDTHVGITSKSAVEDMLVEACVQDFDLMVHTGDWLGGYVDGGAALEWTCEAIRKHWNGPVVATLGNHDIAGGSDLDIFNANLRNIKDSFKKHNIIYIDEEGPYLQDDLVLIGSAGWYTTSYPQTNDGFSLPAQIEGFNPHTHLLQQANKSLDKQLQAVDQMDMTGLTLVFMSHFAVVDNGPDYKGDFQDFNWSTSIADVLRKHYGCKYFLNGHCHQLHEGKNGRYEPGSDYYNPQYRIWEII